MHALELQTLLMGYFIAALVIRRIVVFINTRDINSVVTMTRAEWWLFYGCFAAVASVMLIDEDNSRFMRAILGIILMFGSGIAVWFLVPPTKPPE